MGFIDFIIYSLVYVIFIPILTIIHELGHAIPALIFTQDRVEVDIGNGDLKKQITFKRLSIKINRYKSFADISYGLVTCTTINNRFKSILVSLGGPFSSLIVSILLYVYLMNAELPYILMISFNALLTFSAFQFLLTIFPIKYFYPPYKGYTSDGYNVLQKLKNNSSTK